jgi:hypothetical protein
LDQQFEAQKSAMLSLPLILPKHRKELRKQLIACCARCNTSA